MQNEMQKCQDLENVPIKHTSGGVTIDCDDFLHF